LPLLKTPEGAILASSEPESGECRTKWIFELKYDGFRGLCYVGRGRGWFKSRNGKRMTRFAEFADQLARDIDIHDAVFDGEVIASDDTGRPQFYELLWRSRRPTYVAFDLLWLNGADLRALRSASAGGGCKPFCRRNRSHFRTFGRAIGREARSAALRGYRTTPIAAGADEGIWL